MSEIGTVLRISANPKPGAMVPRRYARSRQWRRCNPGSSLATARARRPDRAPNVSRWHAVTANAARRRSLSRPNHRRDEKTSRDEERFRSHPKPDAASLRGRRSPRCPGCHRDVVVHHRPRRLAGGRMGFSLTPRSSPKRSFKRTLCDRFSVYFSAASKKFRLIRLATGTGLGLCMKHRTWRYA